MTRDTLEILTDLGGSDVSPIAEPTIEDHLPHGRPLSDAEARMFASVILSMDCRGRSGTKRLAEKLIQQQDRIERLSLTMDEHETLALFAADRGARYPKTCDVITRLLAANQEEP